MSPFWSNFRLARERVKGMTAEERQHTFAVMRLDPLGLGASVAGAALALWAANGGTFPANAS